MVIFGIKGAVMVDGTEKPLNTSYRLNGLHLGFLLSRLKVRESTKLPVTGHRALCVKYIVTNMKVEITSDSEVRETLEIPVQEVQPFIDLIKAHGYEDSEGNRYTFAYAQVEPKKIVIYIGLEE